MKDRVFIAWSGSNKVATFVKRILEDEHNYICTIGGNSENTSNMASVGDTVIRQMCSCNQAIVIFQNNAKGNVSSNLYFELGYSFASYGAKKVHCVKQINADILLPSDFDNAFVESIDCEDSEESFARGIVSHFMSRQKMSIDENKMELIDDRYKIHEKIICHYSEAGSKCSDYELAQYVLFYIQAAMMFDDVPRVREELLEFKRKNNNHFSRELEISVNIALAFADLLIGMKEYEDSHDVYIDEDTFFEFKKKYTDYLKIVKEDDIGVLDKWLKLFIHQHLNFAHMLFGNNMENDEETRKNIYRKSIEYGKISLEDVNVLSGMNISRENHDDRGLLTLKRAYISRNMYVCKKFLGEEDAVSWLKQTVEERKYLKNTYGDGTIDSHIYSTFCMEYYLALINYIDEVGKEEMEEFDISMHKKRIKDYLRMVDKENSWTSYLQKIKLWVEKH